MTASAVVLSLSVVGSACGPNASGDGDQAGSDADGVEAPQEWHSPLADFLGVDYSNTDENNERNLENERTRLEWVRSCMAEQGFEYAYQDPSETWIFEPPDDSGPEWGTREWIEIYGFGISTQGFDQETVGPELVAMDQSYFGGEEWIDPNEDYLNTLSESERNAWYEAAYGNDPGYMWDDTLTDDENEAAMDDYYNSDAFQPSGCENVSYEEFNANDPFSAVWTDFEDELTELYERVESDPAMVSKRDDVSRCVAEKGLEYVDQETIYNTFYERMEPVHDMVIWPGQDLTEEDYNSLSQEQLDEIYNQPAVMTDEGKALLGEIQADEIALAIAVDDCGGSDREMSELYQEINVRLEEEFIETHGAELEAYRLTAAG